MAWRDWSALADRIKDIGRDSRMTRVVVVELMKKFRSLEVSVATVSEIVARINAASDNLANDLRSVKARLDEALAGQDAAVQAALAGAVDELTPLADKLDALAAETPEDEPQPEPEPEV